MINEHTIFQNLPAAQLAQPDPPKELNFPETLKGKKVLVATESLGPVNGVSRATLSLIEYLEQHSLDVAVLAPKFEPNSIKAADPEPPTVLRLNGLPLPYNPELKIVYPFRLSKVYNKTFKPDLLYLASPASLGAQILWQLGKRSGPPVIVNFQTDLAAYARTILPLGFNRASGWVVDTLQGHLFRSPNVRKVLYPSGASHDYLVKLGVCEEKLVRVGRGVNTELFSPAHKDDTWRHQLASHGEIILGCVARLSFEKGFDFLAQAALKLAADNFPFKLIITGGNRNPAVEKSIHTLFGGLLGKQVIFTGLLQGQPLARVYASADIFVYPSVTETFGQVIQEAMASGVPVIARNQGGPSDIVQDGKTGYLITPTEVDEFVAAIKRLATRPELRNELGLAARQLALQARWETINNQIALLMDKATGPGIYS